MKKTVAAILSLVMLVLCTACSMGTVKVEVSQDDIQPIIDGIASARGLSGSSSADTGSNDTPAEDVATEAAATEAAADDTAQAAGDVATTASTGSTATTAAAAANSSAAATSGTPSSKDEIIAYYVKAYNKIGTDKGKITRTYDYTSNYNNILNINNNSTLQSLANSLMKQFMVENTEATETSFSDLPPKGVSTLSITSSQVSAATIKDNGTTYTVTLKSTGTDSNYEVDCQPGQGSAGVLGPLLRTEDVSSAAGSALTFEGLHAWYATGTTTATIEKSTGHITALNFEMPCILHFDQVKVVVLKVENCDIGLLFQQKYTIAY